MANMINGSSSADIATKLAADKNKVAFKVGQQTNLDALITGKGGSAGTFYLTNDTHRLYVGNYDGSISAVNEGVITVASIDDLPTLSASSPAQNAPYQGQFYYISGDNILCVCSGNRWVQINSNTNTYITTIGDTVTADAANNKVTHTATFTDNNDVKKTSKVHVVGANGVKVTNIAADGNGVPGIQVSGDTYTISGDGSVTNEANIKLASTNVAGNNSSVTIKGGDNVEVSREGNVITITSTDKYLSSIEGASAATSGATNRVTEDLTFTDNKSNKLHGKFDIAGANGVTVAPLAAAGSGVAGFEITGDTYTLSGDGKTDGTEATIKIASTNASNTSSVVLKAGDNVTVTRSGNDITLAATDTTLVSANGYAGNGAAAYTADGTNGFRIAVADDKGTKNAYLNPEITVGTTDATKTTVKFVNGTATLDVYTKAEIENKMAALNAMTYKGTVKKDGSSTAADSVWKVDTTGGANVYRPFKGNVAQDVSIGDTYLFVEDVQVDGMTVTQMSLAIARSANGQEDANGHISLANLTWDYVASTSNTDTKYGINDAGDATNGYGINLIENVGTANSAVGGIRVKAGDHITVSNTATGTAGAKTQTLTINHAAVGTGTAVSATAKTGLDAVGDMSAVGEKTITYIDGVTADGYGHIAGVTTQTLKIVDTNASVNSFTNTTATATNGAKVTNSIQLKSGNGANQTAVTNEYTITSESLKVTAGTNNVNVELQWDSF